MGEQLTIHECTASEISAYERAQDLGYLDCPKYDLRAGKHPIADMNEREWAESRDAGAGRPIIPGSPLR